MRALLVALALLTLSACAPRDTDAADRSDPITTVPQLEAALSSSGLLLSPRGMTTRALGGASGEEYAVRGVTDGFIQVYRFASEEEADRNVGFIAPSGPSGSVEVYQSGPLVVAAFGRSATINTALRRALGAPRL